MSNSDIPNICRGAHCKCMDRNCKNYHYGDHTCPWSATTHPTVQPSAIPQQADPMLYDGNLTKEQQREKDAAIAAFEASRTPAPDTQPKAQLLAELRVAQDLDPETGHERADELLIDYINDPDIKEAYDAIGKWYA